MSPKSSAHDSLSSSLLDRLQRQDVDAWRRFADLYGPLVYSWCRCGGLLAEDAADVTQEVFVAVNRSLKSFRRDQLESTFRGWIATVTRNKILDHFRRCATQPLARGGSDMQRALQNVPFSEDSTSSDSQKPSDDQILLARAIQLVRAEFEERTWQAFWLTTVIGTSPIDAADELGVSINAVYKARSRVLCRLREELDGLL